MIGAFSSFSSITGNLGVFSIVPLPLVVYLILLGLEVKMQSVGRCVTEDQAPLVEFRAVVVKFVVAFDKRPNVIAVTSRVTSVQV